MMQLVNSQSEIACFVKLVDRVDFVQVAPEQFADEVIPVAKYVVYSPGSAVAFV